MATSAQKWTLKKGLETAKSLQEFFDVCCIPIHVGMTGSVLLKGKSKKDLDLILYPSKTGNKISISDVLDILDQYGYRDLQHRTPDHENDEKQVYAWFGKDKRIDFFLFDFRK